MQAQPGDMQQQQALQAAQIAASHSQVNGSQTLLSSVNASQKSSSVGPGQQSSQGSQQQTRSRSTSDSQKSSRSEKRMGRVFRPPASSNNQPKGSTKSQDAASSAQQNDANNDTSSNTPPNNSVTTSIMHINTGNEAEETIMPPPFPQPDSKHNTAGHSNSSSISSQVGSTTSSTTNHSVTSNNNSNTVNTLSFQQSFTETLNSTSNMHSASTIDSSDHYSKNRLERTDQFLRLSTLPEIDDDSINSLLAVSKKFSVFHHQFIETLKNLHINMSFVFLNFELFLKVLQNVEKKINQKENFNNNSVSDHDPNIENSSTHLTVALTDSIIELKRFIDNLKLYVKSEDFSSSIQSIRMAYFSMFPLFIEISNICKSLAPVSAPTSVTSSRNVYQLQHQLQHQHQTQHKNQSAPPLSSSSMQLSSQTPKSKTTTFTMGLNRIPAPNPQLTTQTILNRQPSISRQQQFSGKLDRHDSELSNSSLQLSDFDDRTLFDLINHTIESFHTVCTQISSVVNFTENSNNNNELVLNKSKELKTQCSKSLEQTNKVQHILSKFNNPNSNSDLDMNKNLLEQTNLLLKSIIKILALTKSTIEDIPRLNEVRSSLSILTKATKELTIKLESSYLKHSVVKSEPTNPVLTEQPKLSSIPSMGNFSQDFFSNSSTNITAFNNSSNSQPPTQPSTQQQQMPQPVLSPNQQTSTTADTSIRRINKLKKIPEHNEHAIDVMKQHIINLELNSAKIAEHQHQQKQLQQPQMTVTTPLIASIGPAVASAVLPMTSPLKTSTSTFMSTSNNLNMSSSNNHNLGVITSSTIDNTIMNGSRATTPNYLGDGSIHNEYNPFDRMVYK